MRATRGAAFYITVRTTTVAVTMTPPPTHTHRTPAGIPARANPQEPPAGAQSGRDSATFLTLSCRSRLRADFSGTCP
jgi:hypothetical protein